MTKRCLTLLVTTLTFVSLAATAADDANTTGNHQIPIEELQIRVTPLTADELRVEADGWQADLQSTVAEIGDLQIQTLALKNEIGEAEPSEEQAQALEQMQTTTSELHLKRDKEIHRLGVVVNELSQRLGLTDANKEQDEVLVFRRYMQAVEGLRTSAVDSETFWTELQDWVLSREGGGRLLRNVLTLIGVMLGAWLLGLLLARLVKKGLDLSGKSSQMLRHFIMRNIPRVMVALGVLFGLSLLGINITPLVAIIGGASFVVAFALQDSLSNFASGIMIMLYQPFDVDDIVDVAGIQGRVKSMTLVSTTITTFDNKILIVPNNSIWGSVITNVTGSHERRVDLVFGIGYGDDMELAERIMREEVEKHPATLSDPEPKIKVHELADSSVNFICRPWVLTDDYWDVYWDLTRTVKERFDAEGVSIPFPQRDVHLITESSAKET